MRNLGVSEMSLRERAIKAYEEWKRGVKEREKQEAQLFAERKAKEFERIFGAKPDEVRPATPYECFIMCDGLTFRVRAAPYRDIFEVSVQCPQCHNQFFREVDSLHGLGETLSNSEKCPKCLDSPEPREPSVEKQIVQKLREILDLLQEE